MVQVCSSRIEDTQFKDYTKHSDDAVSTLTGVMRTKQDLEILKLMEEEIGETFTENREKFRRKPSETF
ncbi:hypothetical protein TNCV_4392671 [Trichonephila clavipes]|nr:hypothetical protein TNCV_4392671 [Trichonephila clavipes]